MYQEQFNKIINQLKSFSDESKKRGYPNPTSH